MAALTKTSVIAVLERFKSVITKHNGCISICLLLDLLLVPHERGLYCLAPALGGQRRVREFERSEPVDLSSSP